MRGLTRRLNGSLASFFSEKRLFLETPTGTAYLRLTPLAQLGLSAGALAAASWVLFATAVLLLGALDERGAAPQAAALSEAARTRIDALAAERDSRAEEALSAQHRFRLAAERLGAQQTDLLHAEAEKRELQAALEGMRQRLAALAAERDLALAESETLRGEADARALAASGGGDLSRTLDTVAATLSETVRVRDTAIAEREALRADAEEAERRLASLSRQHEDMIAELEYAVRTSFVPLEGLFEAADLDLDAVLATVRRDHSGTGGGAEGTVRMSTRSIAPEEAEPNRFDQLLVDLDRMNMLRIAAGRIPYAMPVLDNHRVTSAFGYRRDPKNGRRRMHGGIDLAAPKGTAIHATADGVVTAAGAERGYGKTVRIRHDFGFETLYAHNNSIKVKVGQRVSRGDHISDMGATGRVTGVHLHYEVRRNGQPVNPMVYLEAARDVF